MGEGKICRRLCCGGFEGKKLSNNLNLTNSVKQNWLEVAKDDLYFHKENGNQPIVIVGPELLGAGL